MTFLLALLHITSSLGLASALELEKNAPEQQLRKEMMMTSMMIYKMRVVALGKLENVHRGEVVVK